MLIVSTFEMECIAMVFEVTLLKLHLVTDDIGLVPSDVCKCFALSLSALLRETIDVALSHGCSSELSQKDIWLTMDSLRVVSLSAAWLAVRVLLSQPLL